MTGERETMQLIRQAICSGRLKQPMRWADLNRPWDHMGRELPRQTLPRTGSSTARFVRVSRGLYRLKDSS